MPTVCLEKANKDSYKFGFAKVESGIVLGRQALLKKYNDLISENFNNCNVIDDLFDKNNIFVLGSSMGAYGAWNYLIQRPEVFKGIISVAGGVMLPIKENLKFIKDKAILMYHGDNDDVVDVNVSIGVYNKLKSMGANNIELKIVKDDNHFLTSHAFKDKYMYEWLAKNIKGGY